MNHQNFRVVPATKVFSQSAVKQTGQIDLADMNIYIYNYIYIYIYIWSLCLNLYIMREYPTTSGIKLIPLKKGEKIPKTKLMSQLKLI